MLKRALLILIFITGAFPCLAQKQPIDRYVKDTGGFNDVTAVAPGARTKDQILNVLPLRKSSSFAEYVAAKASGVNLFTLTQDVEKLRMDKQVGSPAGAAGVTSVVSNAVAPALIGLGVEYGSILQNTTGNTNTLRANLLGISKMLVGAEQFPYCPIINQSSCTPASRWLRRFSGVTSFENANKATSTAIAQPVTSTAPTVVNLFGNGFRMVSWGARFDMTANDPSDVKFVGRFQGAIDKLRNSSAPESLAKSIDALFGDPDVVPVYTAWQEQTFTILQQASKDEFKDKLAGQLDLLIDQMMAKSPDFVAKVATLRRASENYYFQRDTLLQEIQSHQFSVEYTNLHAQNQPATSNVRIIYSYQPSVSPLLITANAALTWYNSLPAGVKTGQLRDVQIAGKLDRRLGEIPNLGNAVMTLAGYYQWMKEDALIEIGPGNVAPGSGIVLPGTAATLLGTKGSIGVLQGRVTVPINNTIKIPLSLTWANRTELIKESDTRGQIGMTLDLDSLFR